MGKLIFERTNASSSKDNLLFLEFIMLFGRVILISEIKMKETHLFVSFSFHHLFVFIFTFCHLAELKKKKLKCIMITNVGAE